MNFILFCNTGLFCQEEINECFDNPCLHGICVDVLADYNCLCEPGWTGKSLLTLNTGTEKQKQVGLRFQKISCSTQLSMKFFLLINVKVPTLVSILTYMSRKNSIISLSEPEKSKFLDIFILMSI